MFVRTEAELIPDSSRSGSTDGAVRRTFPGIAPVIDEKSSCAISVKSFSSWTADVWSDAVEEDDKPVEWKQ